MPRYIICLFRSFVVGLLVYVAGCDSATPSAPVAVTSERLAPVSDAGGAVVSGVTEAEAVQFAELWIQAIQAGNIAAGKELIWFEEIVERSMEGFEVEDQFRQGYLSGALKSPAIDQILEQLQANEKAGGSYRLVKVVIRDSQRHAVFRLLGADGSLNYHDLRIVRDRERLRADRFFIAMTGESMSDTMKRNLAPIVARQTTMGRLTGQAKEAVDLAQQQLAVVNALKNGQAEDVLDLFEKLPSTAKLEKTMQMCRLNALAAFEDKTDAYLAALETYAASFPNDPSLGLVLIDAAVLKGDMDLIEQAHKELTLWSAGDPMLDLMVAGVLANHGRATQAKEMVRSVDVNSLGLASAHDFRLSVAVANDDHEETLQQLTALRNGYGYQFSDLRSAEGFERFVASSQHEAWLELQAK